MIFLVLSFFVMQGLVASSDNLSKTSDLSVHLFTHEFNNDIINSIVSHGVDFNIRPVGELPKEVQTLFNFSQISRFWSKVIQFKKEKVLEKFCISPIEYSCLTDNFKEFALLNIDKGESLLFNQRTYAYAVYSESKMILSFFCALYPNLIGCLKPRIKEDVFYFENSLEFNSNRSTQMHVLLNLQICSLHDLKHYFYNLAYKKRFYTIQILSASFLELKKNEYLTKNDYLKVLFTDFFLKAFYERSLFCLYCYKTLKKPYVFYLDPKNKFFIDAYKIDVNALFDECGITPLINAIQKKNIKMVQHLIKVYKASVNAFDHNKKPPLFHAVQGPECIVKMLLSSHDVNLNWIDAENGNTLFHYLTQWSLIESVIGKMLLSHLKNPDFLLTKNKDGKTYKEVQPLEK